MHCIPANSDLLFAVDRIYAMSLPITVIAKPYFSGSGDGKVLFYNILRLWLRTIVISSVSL
jgi:hypothetical protein